MDVDVDTPLNGPLRTFAHFEALSAALGVHGVLGMGAVQPLVRGPDVMSALGVKPGPHLQPLLGRHDFLCAF